MKAANRVFILSIAMFILSLFVYTGASCIQPKPCNPVKQPITVINQSGKDVSCDLIWDPGRYYRNVDGKIQIITINTTQDDYTNTRESGRSSKGN